MQSLEGKQASPLNMDLEYEQECRECFALHDIDGKGYVKASQFLQIARELGQIWTHEESQALKRELNYRAVSTLNMKQFLELMSRRWKVKGDIAKLQSCFHTLDRKRSKAVAVDDLMHFLHRIGDPVQPSDLEAIIVRSLNQIRSIPIRISSPATLTEHQFLTVFLEENSVWQ